MKIYSIGFATDFEPFVKPFSTKMESESFDFTGLKIPRDYLVETEEVFCSNL